MNDELKGRNDIWAKLAEPVPAREVQWRQQGKAKARDGKWFAPFVAYIDAQFVRSRLDTVIAGEWDLHLELLPSLAADGNGEALDEPVAFKAKLQVLGVVREDVGCGRDYKTASTDAFKRAAVRFGIGHELYTDYELVWVEVDGDGKYARVVGDPAAEWVKKANRLSASEGGEARSQNQSASVSATPPSSALPNAQTATGDASDPSCPKCGGRMWDNRLTKKNPKAPDYACRQRSCDGVIWPRKSVAVAAVASRSDEPPPPDDGDLPW